VLVETEANLELLQSANKVCSDSIRNEQVKMNACCINFDGSSANVTLFSSRKIVLFWKVFGWLRVICISTNASNFALWKILIQT